MHSCDNPPCCNPAHLRAGTHAENEADKWARNRTRLQGRSGTANSQARLTDQQVLAIRARYRSGLETQRSLAVQYGVTRQTIGKIVRGLKWSSLPP